MEGARRKDDTQHLPFVDMTYFLNSLEESSSDEDGKNEMKGAMEGSSKAEEREPLSFKEMTMFLDSLEHSCSDEEGTDNDTSESSSSSSECDTGLPSTVTDREYIFFPKGSETIDKCDIESGKWMLFSYNNLEQQDWRWLVLQLLVKNGILSRLKASTALNSERSVICCYTADSSDKILAKKAADAIRESITYNCIMYYKTNEDSVAGVYRKEGHTNISKYMHTVNSHFYEKDEYNRWKQVFFG
ncbi:uncharacterized protein LOC118195844 isoform X1 [Stegodyphus dumicola]|uniref:uncharacterized protein LOC118195844 isoform X1 n=2 Tax=Stegodyphus dumicola TaxID=202533 RepID=UPI0015A7835D|nr:uncharacterized protein LOC118195844 isoform X1 [Stegodyphus dumicola]